MKSPHRNKKGERKVKRVVLGEGHLWTDQDSVELYQDANLYGALLGKVKILDIFYGKKIRLIAEIIP